MFLPTIPAPLSLAVHFHFPKVNHYKTKKINVIEGVTGGGILRVLLPHTVTKNNYLARSDIYSSFHLMKLLL